MSTTSNQHLKPEIDLNKVPPLDHHRTAVTFNCLILKMTEILNNFGNKMEDVLERAEKTLDTADRKLRLMEAKLATVTIEEKCTEAVQFTPTTSDGSAIEQTKTAATTTSPLPIIPRVSEENTELVESAPAILIKDDPEYNKYFKMLKMGVPEAGVIQKMESEGIDSSILKRGDEPSRSQISKSAGYESSGESVSSFSDSD
ncbi:hypothetical protein GCK72_006080 [Caenorhabditis remanei]|uniref:Uncharacterized protein n=1 Tax=Caenorhabditis remanei TaxID=31234 RepID=A0A6A5HHJ5_CAERE|nr:hypothetical protein GCK72_006080 [Caenorhabditis remanei]KAF1766124.1 hypothetical protein GCK72_006080 [Caenorhabditis remanei]